MNNYYIGIIDEDQDEIQDIKRTILINKPESMSEDLIQFVDYPLPESASVLSDEVTNSVLRDIVNGTIHLLIVDYRIIVESTYVEGTEIFNKISSLVSKFPTIILTNVPDDYYKPFIDADKVYSKRAFFKVDENYSQEKTRNIFRNIENYKSQREQLSATLGEQLLKLETQGYSLETYQSIISLEKALDAYLPQGQSTVEKDLSITELKDAVDLLKEANGLIGGNDED